MRLVFVILCFACLTHASFALSPFALKLQVSRGEYTGWVEVTNNQDKKPIAVELSVHERILNLDGDVTEPLLPNRDFVVYPSELLLYPGEKAKVQVVFNSKEKITSDKAYILQAKEIPLPIPQESPGNKPMIGFNTLVTYRATIALETGKSGSLTFSSSHSLDSGKVELIVENKSSGRVPVEQLYLLVNGKKVTDFSGKNNSIMPGQKRRFVFVYPKALTAKEVRFGTDGPSN
jgi:P pilus assembly chaperone PapD